jgi:hypothetical protein
MTITIKLRNSVTTTNAPSTLQQGEVAINITDKKVWVGNAATTPVLLLGSGADGTFTNLTVSGVASFADGTVSLPSITNIGDTNTGIFFPAADTIAFTEGGVESMRIDSSGNVGIGVTPSAWFASANVLQIGKASAVYANTGVNQVKLLNNVRFDASGNPLYLSTGTAQDYTVDASGNFIWSSAISGSAGGAVTFLERMRIDSAGNVGIGTSSPTRKLQVAGAGEFFGTSIDSTLILTATGVANTVVGFNNSGSTNFAGASNNVGYVSVAQAYPLVFGTSATERMRIDSGGNLLVGLTAAVGGAKVEIKGSGTSAAAYQIYSTDSAGTINFYVRNDGIFCTGVGANSPYNYTTANAANVYVESNGVLFRSTSSIKYKTDVQDATHGLAEVLKLRPVTYKGKNDGNTIFGGLIAEEVDAIGLKEFVQYDEDSNPDALAYGQMVALAFKAIQEQQALIETLTTRLNALEGK